MQDRIKQAALADELFAGASEMAALMRSIDWSKTALGPVETWPNSLRTSLSICLHSRFPILIWWGPDLAMLYNDSYRHIIAAKHPLALGAAGREVFPEIWQIIGPMLNGVIKQGNATWSDDQLLVLERSGFPEECYFTFSYSPIPDGFGHIGGVFTAVTETTGKVVGERRLSALRELAACAGNARTVDQACQNAAEALANAAIDIPFALIYILDEDGDQASLLGAAGITPGSLAAPTTIKLDDSLAWPLGEVARTREPLRLDDLARFGPLPVAPWAVPPHAGMVLPLAVPGQERAAGFLVAGASPRRALDADYSSFFNLIAGQIATSIADARAYEQERRRVQALAELDRAKTTFFSNVSHEFRTPLTLLLGPLEDALANFNEELPAPLRADLETAHRNAVRLLRLVNTLLDFARLEAGRVEAVYEPTDLAQLTLDLASNFRSAIERAGLVFTVDCPPLGEPMYVDREMWEKIVLNLLSNALKFTFSGEIAVSLHKEEGKAVLVVRDTGTGIVPEELSQVFERFHRIRGAQARTLEGTGIGLALVHELVQLHGGTIQVHSILGAGTAFTVHVPTGSAHLPPDRIGVSRTLASTSTGASPYIEEALRWLPGEALVPNTDLLTGEFIDPEHVSFGLARDRTKAAHILLADDNADMRAYIERLLGARWQVHSVNDGATALNEARRQLPDLVITDVMMPGLDGFQLLRALREDSATRAIPVILLSARAGEESRVEGLQAGADDYLVKPFSARELIARVSAHLELARIRREAQQREHEHAEELQKLYKEAQAAIRMRDQFFSVASHELKTPLTSMMGYAELLKRYTSSDTGLDARTRRAIQIVLEQTQRLNKMITALLDVTRIEAGKLVLEPAPFDLVQLVQRLIDELRPTMRNHTIELNSTVQSLVFDGDELRLEQVLQNLVQNGIKYSPDGGVVRIELGVSGEYATIAVSDSGIGIAEADLAHLFDRFYRAETAEKMNIAGMGIGLYVVREIVQLHGGRIEVSSEPGKGSTFTVWLPLEKDVDPKGF